MIKWTRKWIPSLLAAVMFVSIPVSSTSLTAYAEAETVLEVERVLTYEEHRKAIQDALEGYQKEPIKDILITVIDTFLKLPTLEEYPKIDFVNDKKDFAEDVLLEINKMTDEIEKLEVLTYFATQAVDLIFTSKSFNDYGVANSLISMLPEGDVRKDLTAKLEQSKDVLPKPSDGYIDWNNPPGNLNDYLDKNPIPDYDNLPPGIDKDDYESGNSKPLPPLSLYDRSEISYRVEGAKCYKISDHYKDGKLVKTEKTTPDKTELLFCGSYAGTVTENNPFPGIGGETNIKPPTEGVFNGFDPYSDAEMDKIREEEDQESVKNIYKIEYTFEKSSDSPYYFDSGIAISEDKTLSYTQAKDIVLMISIHAKGKFVEDHMQSIGLIDGKIIKVVDDKKPITFETFASWFDETDSDVRVTDSSKKDQ